MKAVTYSNAKKNLKELIQDVCNNSEPAIIVSSKTNEQAVLISLSDYESMEETAYLLGTPANRKHLMRSLKEAEEGKVVNFPADDL